MQIAQRSRRSAPPSGGALTNRKPWFLTGRQLQPAYSLPMQEFQPVTDADLARARVDEPFRRQMLTRSLGCLLGELSKVQHAPQDATRAGQVREGIALAVRLSDLLRRTAADSTPAA